MRTPTSHSYDGRQQKLTILLPQVTVEGVGGVKQVILEGCVGTERDPGLRPCVSSGRQVGKGLHRGSASLLWEEGSGPGDH